MTKARALNLNALFLLIIACLDVVRGFMHTFLNGFASEHIAMIDAHPDALFLLGVFGISNFVTAMIYFVIYKKAKQIAPYVLLAIFFGYLLGIIGIRTDGLRMQSAFNGQYMMFVYLAFTLIFPSIFFLSKNQPANQD